jgi:trans-aconitate methyltransferase
MNTRDHWETAYAARHADEQSWFQKKPERSLAMIRRAGGDADSPIIDVGGGASNLVDFLLDEAYEDLTVLDISATAIDEARQRLGNRASRVQWLQQDVLTFVPPRQYAVWHDRAVFHFLTGEQDQRLYTDVLRCALQTGGQLVIATFAPDGPTVCSGLDVMRHDAASLGRALGDRFHLEEEATEDHITPAGRSQRFGYYRFNYG